MAHKPTVPCTKCGKLLWHHTKTSIAQPICRPCRATQRQAAARDHSPKPSTRTSTLPGRRRRERQCEICAATYEPTYSAQRSCGRKCGLALKRRIGSLPPEPRAQARKAPPEPRTFICAVCGATDQTMSGRRKICHRTECAREQSRLHMNANYERYKDRILVQAHRRRALLKAQFVEDVSLAVLYERDQGRCGVCHRKVMKPGGLKRGPLMASIDHIVPISEGGEHSYANTRLTHYRCNLARSNRGGNEQLALIG